MSPRPSPDAVPTLPATERPMSPPRPRIRSLLPAAAAALALAGPLAAQDEPSPAGSEEALPAAGALEQGVDEALPGDGPPELVIYADGRVLAVERLRLELSAGTDTVLWTGAPDRLDPASLSLGFPGADGPEVLETVHRPAATGPDAALAGLTGREVVVRTRDGTVHRGRLVAAGGGAVTLRTGDGDEDAETGVAVVPEGRVASYRLPGLPGTFRVRPAVVWTVRSEQAGERRAEVGYLAGGTGWDAEYVAHLAPDEERMSLTARAVLQNGTDRTWEDARVKLVAGEVGREESDASGRAMAMTVREDAAGDAGARERAVGDFHVYELPRPVTLEAGASVRALLTRSEEVEVRRLYRAESGTPGRWPPPRPVTSPGFGPDHQEEHVSVVLALANREASGLGRPLPAGRVRVYRRDEDGGLLLAGADRIGDTPAGDSLHLETARAFDVVRERTVTDLRRPSDRALEEDVRVELRNAKEEAVTVQVVERLARWIDGEVVEARVDGEAAAPERLDAGRVLWRVRVPAGGSSELTYTARYTWTPEDER